MNENISIAQGLINNSLDNSKCYEVTQDLPFEKNKFKKESKIFFSPKILDDSGRITTINTKKNYINFSNNEISNLDNILMGNKIREVHNLGQYLKKGEFENLFNLVGILNQSDPKQKYLENSEKIYKQRYEETKNIDHLYSVLISQILQKKVKNAEVTIDRILNFDFANGNTYLTKSIIKIYLIKPKEAKEVINRAKIYNISSESKPILDILEGVVNIMNFKFLDAYQILS